MVWKQLLYLRFSNFDLPFYKAFRILDNFASLARVLDISEFQDINLPKRRTLLLCLVYEAQVKTRDYLVEIFIKRILDIQNNAKLRLQELRDKHVTETSELLATFGQVLKASKKAKENQDNTVLSRDGCKCLQDGLKKPIM